MSKKSPEVEEIKIDVIGPGSLLSEARIQSGLSIDDVANKLNFRVMLVKNIEADIFDKTLPDTYNRGYLKNYAKLVNISIPEVIEIYEKFHVFQEGGAKMQSFSRGTMKKAENSILMWITYLILAIFISLTVMWWIQEDKKPSAQQNILPTTEIEIATTSLNDKSPEPESRIEVDTIIENETSEQVPIITNELHNTQTQEVAAELNSEVLAISNSTTIQSAYEVIVSEKAALTKVIFTFAGDCWVNIHDALGERIAWGIKKSGYVMTIDAKAPLKITIGKPELVKIDFGGESVDMSMFPKGHIAKFNLPLSPQS